MMKTMTPLAGLLFILAIASTKATPEHFLYNNVTDNMILRTYDGGAPQGRIINGVPAKLFSRPYQASLQVYLPSEGGWLHICGAVILDHNLLACAAHCLVVFPVEDLRIEVGLLDLTAPPLKYTQVLEVSSVKPHENFTGILDSSAFPYDIGLIYTKQRIVYNANVKPILIAPPGINFAGQECVISGWGNIKFGGPASPVLLEAKMKIWSHEQCYTLHEPFGFLIDRNHICVKGESKDGLHPGGCNGDSGGPLVCGHVFKYLLGVTSYVFDGCNIDYPTVYTRVPGYIDWIWKNKQEQNSS